MSIGRGRSPQEGRHLHCAPDGKYGQPCLCLPRHSKNGYPAILHAHGSGAKRQRQLVERPESSAHDALASRSCPPVDADVDLRLFRTTPFHVVPGGPADTTHTFGHVAATETSQRSIVEILCFNLASIRKARSLSQAQLGEGAGITRNHYQLLESGRTGTGDLANPRLSTLISLAEVLGVPVTTLLQSPTPFTVWRWFRPTSTASDDVVQQVFDALITASEDQLDGNGAAFVGRDEARLAVAIGVKAPSEEVARLVGGHLMSDALSAAVEGQFTRTTHVDRDLNGLVRSSEA